MTTLKEINQKKYFSIVIPTMWDNDMIHKMLDIYETNILVKEIILIDNNPDKKPNLDKYSKIIYHTEGKNLYRNPSWNLGVSLSNFQIILVDDNIFIDNLSKILESLINTEFDLVGTKLGEFTQDFNISHIDKIPKNDFGVFMYVKNYVYIPEQLKVGFGVDILFRNSKTPGIIENYGITLGSKKNNVELLNNDKILYDNLISESEEFNIIVRTSGRKNYFRHCVHSIKKYYPSAKVHITLDDESDLEYVKENIGDLKWSYYLINKNTVTNITNKIKLNRTPKFIYNYYFNIVKPFLNGWVMYLDDDDEMIQSPTFDWDKKDLINLYKADLKNKIVPSPQNFGGNPMLNDISTLCVILHSKNLIDWVPNRGGDYDFINELYSNHDVVWYDTINCKIQKTAGYGQRKDKFDERINGFYLNLDRRKDRKIKMESEILKTSHNIKRYKAIDGKKLSNLKKFKGTIPNSELGQYAIFLSHYNMIKYAKDNGWNKIIILEDDVTLCDDFDSRLDLFLDKIPNNWKIAYLGFNETKDTQLIKINEYVYRVIDTYGTFGMIINSSAYDMILKILEEKNTVIDWIIKEFIQPKYECYTFLPSFLYVNDDYSDLWNSYRKLDRIKKYFKNVLVEKSEYIVTPFIKKETNLEKLKKLMNLSERKKIEINYDDINSVLNKKENFYKTNSSIKPLRENIPQNRNEITQLKKDSLAKTSRDLFSKGKKYKG